MIKRRNVVSFIVLFTIILQLVPITPPLHSYGSTNNIHVLISAYFEYWQDPTTGIWLYDDANGRHTDIGRNDPTGFHLNKYYVNLTVPDGYRLKNFQVFTHENNHANLQNWTGKEYETIRRYRVNNLAIKDPVNKFLNTIGNFKVEVSFRLPDRQNFADRDVVKGISVYRHYMPVVMELEPIITPDKVIVKYQDQEGNTLRPDDAVRNLPLAGWNDVYPDSVKHNAILGEGYTLVRPNSGYDKVYNSNKNDTYEIIFVYKPPANQAYARVTGFVTPEVSQLVNGKADVRVTVRGEVLGLAPNEVVQRWELFYSKPGTPEQKHINNTSNLTAQYQFPMVEITGETIFPIKAIVTTNKGSYEAKGSVLALIQEPPAPPNVEIKPELYIDAWYTPIQIYQDEWDKNVGKEIQVYLDASASTASEGISKYHYRLKTQKSTWSQPLIWTNWISTDKLGTSTEGEKIVIYPSDADANKVVELQARVGVEDKKGNISYSSTRTRNLQFEIIKAPPETAINLPNIFYPTFATKHPTYGIQYLNNNKITWDYEHPDQEEMHSTTYKLYKVNDDGMENLIKSETREGPSSNVALRELIVEGEPSQRFKLEVSVKDVLGSVGAAVEYFEIDAGDPKMKIDIPSYTYIRENISPTIVFPDMDKYPNRFIDLNNVIYKEWSILQFADQIAQGTGEIPNEVYLERLDAGGKYEEGKWYVAMQTINVLGKDIHASASFYIVPVLPPRIYETIIRPDNSYYHDYMSTYIDDVTPSYLNVIQEQTPGIENLANYVPSIKY